MRPFGIDVIEIVTGFVQSNILHHGLYAKEGSLYLPIKQTIENIKNQGNANGMPTDVYARAVVEQLMRKRTSPEIWEGAMTKRLRFMVSLLPLQVLVSY